MDQTPSVTPDGLPDLPDFDEALVFSARDADTASLSPGASQERRAPDALPLPARSGTHPVMRPAPSVPPSAAVAPQQPWYRTIEGRRALTAGALLLLVCLVLSGLFLVLAGH